MRDWDREVEELDAILMRERRSSEIVLDPKEAAEVLGVTRWTLYRYRGMFPDFPPLPCHKARLKSWANLRGVPRRRGPALSWNTRRIMMWVQEGVPICECARRLKVSYQCAWQAWYRQSKRKAFMVFS